MRLVIEPGHGVVGLRHEAGLGEPPARPRLEQRQASAMHEIMDQRGDEYGLAGARETSDAEPHSRRAAPDRGIAHIVEDDPRLVGKGRQGRQDSLPMPILAGAAAATTGAGSDSKKKTAKCRKRSRLIAIARLYPGLPR